MVAGSANPDRGRSRFFGRLRSSSVATIGVLAAAVLPVMGCGGAGEEVAPQESEQTLEPLSEEAQALVNDANLAQREGRYAEALHLFGQAVEIHPHHPVPQFGSLMAAMAVGDTALASSMRERLAVTGPGLLDMLGPEGTMGGMAPAMPGAEHMPSGMPPGHPTFEEMPDTLRPGRGLGG